MDNIYMRVARIEAQYNYDRSISLEGLWHAYEGEKQQGNVVTAAEFAREIRNRLLEETDNRMTLDRLKLPQIEGDDIRNWLPFLQDLGKVLSGEWAQYRQDLRDLPEQEGWPLRIKWPIRPDERPEEEETFPKENQEEEEVEEEL